MSRTFKHSPARAWLLSRPWMVGLVVLLFLFGICSVIIKQRFEIRQKESKQFAVAMAESVKTRLQHSDSYHVPLTLLIDTSGRPGYYFQLSRIHSTTRQREHLLPERPDFVSYARVSFHLSGGDYDIEVMPVNHKTPFERMLPSLIISFILSLLMSLFVVYLAKIPSRLQKMVSQQSKALEKSEKRNRAIVNALPDMAFVVNKEGQITDYNNPFDHPTYFPGKDFVGKKIAEVMPQAIANEFQHYIAKALSEKQLLTHSYQVNVADEPRNYEARYITQSSEDILVVVRDITDTKRAEQRIRESEEKYRTLVEQAADSIFIADFLGKLLVVNPAATRLSQYSEQELLKMTLHDFAVAEDIQATPFKFEEIASGKTTRSERKMRRKDGSIIDVEILAKIISSDRFLVFLRDITERKQADQEILKSREDLRKLSNYIENVREEERRNIAREIHDGLGQQLTVLKMDVARLGKKISQHDQAGEPEVNNLLSSINKMVEAVRKISAELRPGLLDDLGLVAAIEWYCSDFSKKTGIKSLFSPIIEKEESLSPKINIATFRIFQESLANVAAHSGARKTDISLMVREDQLVLLIEDDGRGFDTEEIKDKKTLGIMGMKERALMIGGIYNIYSTPGKGTVMELVVSLSPEDFASPGFHHL